LCSPTGDRIISTKRARTDRATCRLETSYLCHYAHQADLESVAHASGEMREWMMQPKLQLVRRYHGKPSEFVLVATAYTRAAAERMELWKEVDDGRRVVQVVETFEEAKKRRRFFPRPQSPPTADLSCSRLKRA
jgi:hypothetical protein